MKFLFCLKSGMTLGDKMNDRLIDGNSLFLGELADDMIYSRREPDWPRIDWISHLTALLGYGRLDKSGGPSNIALERFIARVPSRALVCPALFLEKGE